MLKIRELNKTYTNHIQALKEINLDVPPGVFGLLAHFIAALTFFVDFLLPVK